MSKFFSSIYVNNTDDAIRQVRSTHKKEFPLVYIPIGPYDNKYFPSDLTGTELEVNYLSYCQHVQSMGMSPTLGYFTRSPTVYTEAFVAVYDNNFYSNVFLEQMENHLQNKKQNIGICSIPANILILETLFEKCLNFELLEFDVSQLAEKYEVTVTVAFTVKTYYE